MNYHKLVTLKTGGLWQNGHMLFGLFLGTSCATDLSGHK